MKILKRIAFVVIALVLLLLVVGFFLPSKVHVERSLVIAAPASEIYANVIDLKNWQDWSPWNLRDPEMKVSYEPTSAGVEARSTWESATQGNGTQTITEATPDKSITTALDFGKQGTATAHWTFEPEGDGTKVTWDMDTELGSPIARLFGPMMDGMIGKDYEEGLANLKGIIEKTPAPEK